VLALGKDGNAYLVNRNNLGGVTSPVALQAVDGVTRGQSSATYHTNQGTYFVFRTGSGGISAYKVTATNPPAIVPAWSVNQERAGLPMGYKPPMGPTTQSYGWLVPRVTTGLHGYNGDTGAVIYAGGGANELMTGDRKWNSGMVARGSIYVANDNKVYKFNVPGGAPTPTPSPSVSPTATPPATPTPTPTATPPITSNSASESYTYSYAHADRQSYGKSDRHAYSYATSNTEASPDAAAASDPAAPAVGAALSSVRPAIRSRWQRDASPENLDACWPRLSDNALRTTRSTYVDRLLPW